MTSRERVHAVFAGQPADRLPVSVLYFPLYQRDHFAELTGRPPADLWKLLYAEPEEYLRTFLEMMGKTPFDIYQPETAPPRQERATTEFVERDGQVFRYDRARDLLTPIPQPVSGHATDYAANQTQYVFDQEDVSELVTVAKAEDLIARGVNDYLDAVVRAVGNREFILSGGVIGTVYSCGEYVGQANVYAMMVEQPGLIEHLSWRIVEQNIEQIRCLAAAGGDAIYIDDATATSDVISVAHYERFCLPYLKEMVREIDALGHKAILIYFGGIADRLEQIASVGADALAMETSMKGYVNDLRGIAERIGDRMALFGNVDPVGVLEKAGDAALEAEVARQVAAGRRARGFVICTGSPITPRTPLSRVQRFIELSHHLGRADRSPAKQGAEGRR